MTQKIVTSAHRIARGEQKELRLGNIKIQRDWGWAPEYVEAMHRMLQQETPEDFVTAAFEYFGLDWEKFTHTDERLLRPTEIMVGRGNALKAEQKLGWKAKYHMEDVVRMMAEATEHKKERIGQ